MTWMFETDPEFQEEHEGTTDVFPTMHIPRLRRQGRDRYADILESTGATV